MVESKCGVKCSECGWRESTGCKGCMEQAGELFWGECNLAKCCITKNHQHCGKCEEFPCKTLKDYAYDRVHGDGGKRIETLESWR